MALLGAWCAVGHSRRKADGSHFSLSSVSPTERSCSWKDLPPLAVEPVETNGEDRGKEDQNSFPPRHLPALLGQEGDLGVSNPKAQESRAGALVGGC